MGMKGISPVIASVLLIGITVAIGVMMSSWITHWIGNKTQDISSACATSTNYKIDSVSYSLSAETMTIEITNIGNVDVYGFGVQVMNGTDVMFYNSTDTKFKISPNITQSGPLKQQRSAIIILSMDTDYESGLGRSLDIIKVLNGACPAFSAETRTITKE
jgi:flagellin-like protein